jgi:hypothetical protein
VADFYRKRVEEILALDAQEWAERENSIQDEDEEISQDFVKQGLSHYAIKYNPFMGVMSDYFTTED